MRRPSRRKHAVAIVVLFVLSAVSLSRARKAFVAPFPHFWELDLTHDGLQDIGFVVTGFRALAADIAWIQLLQYSAGGIFPDDKKEDPRYDYLEYYTRRVTRIDPQFHQAYLYSAGILAYFRNVERIDSALEILDEGIRNNPTYWPLHTFRASILLKQSEQSDEMVTQLFKATRHPDCPAVIHSVLAGALKKRGELVKALAIWQGLLENDKARDYWDYARSQMREIVDILENRRGGGSRGSSSLGRVQPS